MKTIAEFVKIGSYLVIGLISLGFLLLLFQMGEFNLNNLVPIESLENLEYLGSWIVLFSLGLLVLISTLRLPIAGVIFLKDGDLKFHIFSMLSFLLILASGLIRLSM